MKNIKKRLALFVIVIVLVLSFTGTAFATGSNLSHSGTGSYYSSDYVSQMRDNELNCTMVVMCTGTTTVAPFYYSGGYKVYITLAYQYLTTNAEFYIPNYGSVRHIHLDVHAWNPSYMTYAFWYLYP